ncbi:MAG: NAD(P)-dependent dehydrogenase (short-subunit alcohol dehydrogenase family) [Arcticibacterium sp.]|jgi:NAD(P)-dependent dehydrogenase (short-subunit alcohol dehydrogenase family)
MKNYLIIGGSSGIGKELVALLKDEEAHVYATYHKNAVENQANVTYYKFDVLNDSLNLDDLPEEIHGLAYCPGSINLKPFHRFKEADFIDDFKLQVLGATNLIQTILPRLKKSGDASIVLFSTIAVQRGFNFHSQVAISKGAIEGLTRSLAAELAPSIRVNAVAPSLTDTALASKFLNSPEKVAAQAENNPLKRVGSAKEVAATAAFLLSPKSSWTTGQILHVDGGFSHLK